MRRFIVQLALLLIVVTVGYLALFQRDAVMDWFRKAKNTVKGYKPAKTPEEALDSFTKAMKERDYDAAESYLGGDYVVQFRKAAPAAKKLGTAIDNFLDVMEQHNIKSDRVRKTLLDMDFFPTNLKWREPKKQGEDKATAILVTETDPRAPGRLKGMVGEPVEVRREGDEWKIYIPLSRTFQERVDYLVDKQQNYVKALDVVKGRMKTDAVTKSNVETDLKEELRQAGEP